MIKREDHNVNHDKTRNIIKFNDFFERNESRNNDRNHARNVNKYSRLNFFRLDLFS